MPEPEIRNAHFVLLAKGGVGKSFVANMLIQYLKDECGKDILAIDADPANSSLAAIPAFQAESFPFGSSDGSDEIIDDMMERIGEAGKDVVVDTGAACFGPLIEYLKDSGIQEAMLEEAGVRFVIHTIATGGNGAIFTAAGIGSIIENFPPDTPVIVWQNEYFGPVEVEGRPFEEWAVARQNPDRFHGIVTLKEWRRNTYGRDLSRMLKDGLTFAEAQQQEGYRLTTRSRLFRIRKQIFDSIAIAMTGL